jgi:hypothetical protein
VDEAELTKLLGRIERASKGHSEHERANLGRDLAAVEKRLAAGEYASTDFIAKNTFDVPRRTREFFAYMCSLDRLADRTGEAIRSALSSSSEVREVIDLCPGRIPKVEMALMRLGFGGSVTAADKDGEALADLEAFAKMLAPAFSLRVHATDVFAHTGQLKADLVIANHVIDDLLIDRHALELGIDTARIYEEEDELQSAWKRILGDRERLARTFPPALARSLAHFVGPGGRLLITQYAGYVETLLGGSEATEFFLHLFDSTVDELGRIGFVGSRTNSGSSGSRIALQTLQTVTPAGTR